MGRFRGRSTRKGRQNEVLAGETLRLEEAMVWRGDGTMCKERSRRSSGGEDVKM